MRKMKMMIAGIALSAALPGAASADDGVNPWADCGIGALIFSSVHPALSVISNIIWDLGTTAVTSAVSSEDSCAGKNATTAALFIQESYASLETETAQGKGEHLDALMALASCDVASKNDVVDSLRVRLQGAASDQGYADLSLQDKAQNYFMMVRESVAQKPGQCQAI